MRRNRRILLLFAFVWAFCVVIYIYKSGGDEVRAIFHSLHSKKHKHGSNIFLMSGGSAFALWAFESGS